MLLRKVQLHKICRYIMEKSIKLLSNRKRDIVNILEDINTDKPEIVKDIYELSDSMFDFLKLKDIEWLNKFYNMTKFFIENEFESNGSYDIQQIMLSCKNINKEFINYFFDGLKLCNVVDKKNKNEEDENNENCEDNIDEVEIENNKNMENNENFEWRDGQLEAIIKIAANDFLSGLISMITGSGKSLIFLKTIDEHFSEKKPKKGSIYILTCPRIDIIRSLFFKSNKHGKYVLNNERIIYWKDNDIINLDNFNIIDCVNNLASTVVFDLKKYNLLLINNDSFKVLYKNVKHQEYINKNTNLVIIDECQSLSAVKFYDIIEKMKYDHEIPVIGFSATAIRDTKKSEEKVINILSKSFDRDTKDKKINLIYSYDLLQGIKDEVVLPYRIECVLINMIKGHKIGVTNKETLNNILKKLIDVKSKKLPYKKFVVWTNKKEIMKECYLYVKKSFPQLKVYCTSSFDNELSKEGFDTNYEEYYHSKGNSILICINKCKEGSDIPYVDCGIYFDGVKNRSILVHIQTSGRLIRPDIDNKKTHGDLIDTFILGDNENPHTLTAQKILSYLTRLLNLSEDEYVDQIEYYKQMSNLANNMEYNSTEQTLKIKVDKNTKHDTIIELKKMQIIQMDWTLLKSELVKQVDKKFGISDDEKFNIIIQQIIKTKKFNKDCDFWKIYDEVKDKYNLPDDFNETYKHKFNEKTWYEWLKIDTNKWYQSYTKIKQKVNGPLNKKNYVIALKKNKKLPPYPEYLIKDFWDKNKMAKYQ